jgi:hypothetical protein
VYVAGRVDGHAVYWKNGKKIKLPGYGSSGSIYVVGSDVYITTDKIDAFDFDAAYASYWKNKQQIKLSNKYSAAKSICVVKSDVYVAGYVKLDENECAVYWKNGEEIKLPDGAYAGAFYVVGADVYVAGRVDGHAVYWKNGKEIRLSNEMSAANSIYVVNSDVYVAGTRYFDGSDNRNAVYWVNGEEVSLTANTNGLSYADQIFVVINY